MKKNSAAGVVSLFISVAPVLAEPRTQEFQVRLLSPIASYSAPGTPFSGKILGTLDHSEEASLPPGTLVHGSVSRANTVGLGLKRERAVLKVDFRNCELPTGAAVECEPSLVAVDNARESVRAGNHVEGILAAAHPHSWLDGLWYRPTSDFLKRSPTGLTGARGLAQSRLIPTPTGAAIVIGSRLILTKFPDPEITLPVGADLILRISTEDAPSQSPGADPTERRLSPELEQWLREQPVEIRRANRKPVADIPNVALVGTRDGLAKAFEAAGWSPADPLTRKTFARTYAAYSSMSGYPSAPVSPLYYDGRLPDLVFQKSLNSLAMRHHIRFWEVESPEGPLWLGGATHDTAVVFDWKRLTITHQIDTRIDRERSVILNDLRAAQCLSAVEMVARPDVPAVVDRTVTTDGKLAVGFVQDCSPSTETAPVLKKPRRRAPAKVAQRAILETRHYFARGNIYYRAYQAVRWMSNGRRKQVAGAERDDFLLSSAPSDDKVDRRTKEPVVR